jgi:hypothetical protein
VALVALRLPIEPGTATLQHSDVYIVTNLKKKKKGKKTGIRWNPVITTSDHATPRL